MKTALAIASLVVFIVHGVVFYDQFFHKWERHQTAYFDQARTQARNESEKAELAGRSPKIEQIMVTQFGDQRVDRCVTCHMASDDPRFKDHFQPLKTHPYSAAMGDAMVNGRWERKHKFNDFGCTVCHDGQGRGLEVDYAHGADPSWPEPLLGYQIQSTWRKEFQPHLKGKDYIEAACAQCHTEENFAGTPHVNRGRQLFFANNCYGCHKIEGLSDGVLAPDLTEVGRKWRVDYLWESIVDPRANLATSFMPKFNLSDEDVKALTIFLKSRRGINFNETSLSRYKAHLTGAKVEEPGTRPVASSGDLAARGAQLIRDKACIACHKLGKLDGGIAPDLSYEGLIKDEPWVFDHFKSPRTLVPDSIMPQFRFTEDEFHAMTASLMTYKSPAPAMSAADAYKELCSRCHGEKGDGNGKVALYIDPSPRDFTKAAFFNSKPRERFIESIRNGVAGTSMPAWGKVIGDAQVNAIFDYVTTSFIKETRKEQKPHNLPEKNPVASSPASITAGEQIFMARCTGCHGRKQDGKGLNALDLLPHPRNLRNVWFVQSMSDRRMMESILYGVQGTAMPPWIDYGLSQKDAGDLMNFIRSLTVKSGKVNRAGLN